MTTGARKPVFEVSDWVIKPACLLVSEILDLVTTENRLNEPRHEKSGFLCICENKDADQLCASREADQHLCFRYIASTIPLFPKYKISSL